MSLSNTHPQYDEMKPDWLIMRHTYKGQSEVKRHREAYLPATSAQRADGLALGQDGRAEYDAYLLRAQFYEYVKEGVNALTGLMHKKPPTITLPAAMEPLRDVATPTGEGLINLLRRINVEQLVLGRTGLLVDMEENPDPSAPLPRVAIYYAESIINWADKNFVVLDESEFEVSTDFNWDWQQKYRLLCIGDMTEDSPKVYRQGVFRGQNFDASQLIEPKLRGKTLDYIPFVFINTCDTVTEPDTPPLIGLANLALAIYRGDADYRQNLFMQGQDTLVTIGLRGGGYGGPLEDGAVDSLRTGAGARIDLDVGGDAKYIGVQSSGLAEQRQALAADHERASAKAGQFATKSGNERESGESLKTRISAQTATLKQIAITGAEGLQTALRMVAAWMGLNPEEVVVEPNLEFADVDLSGEELLKIMTARSMGAPISLQSVHGLMVDHGLTKLDFETELDIIEDEVGQGLGGNPGQDKEDPADGDKVDGNDPDGE